jgi:hypothetical protein
VVEKFIEKQGVYIFNGVFCTKQQHEKNFIEQEFKPSYEEIIYSQKENTKRSSKKFQERKHKKTIEAPLQTKNIFL